MGLRAEGGVVRVGGGGPVVVSHVARVALLVRVEASSGVLGEAGVEVGCNPESRIEPRLLWW